MKMSTKGRYGLRVMVELARRHGAGPVMVDLIATNQELSASYAHLLLGSLKSAGLVRSVRGPSGGYELSRSPSLITAFDVISAVEGDAPVDCVARPEGCNRSPTCAVREVWCEVAAAVEKVLASVTLEELAARQGAKEATPPMYEI
ncbi:MAG: RrF2 family transcriptional regulator [Myxococcales bacterium]|jgi:Rrf2 family cysteine metabolism transcriptional repressor